MELRVLQYFLAVAREQSIVRAAESLHLSPAHSFHSDKGHGGRIRKTAVHPGDKGLQKSHAHRRRNASEETKRRV